MAITLVCASAGELPCQGQFLDNVLAAWIIKGVEDAGEVNGGGMEWSGHMKLFSY